MRKKKAPSSGREAVLVAVWPGMGSVAATAGFYLMSKLNMRESAAWRQGDFLDPDHVDIKDGLVQPGTPPLGRFFEGPATQGPRTVVVYLGEKASSFRRKALCDRLLDFAEKAGVGTVYTFAALATDMELTGASRVLGAATDGAGLDALRRQEIELLDSGKITGLNGLFLAAAAKRGMRGTCLLGEIPSLAAHGPFPRASRRVLEAFSKLTGIAVDLSELVSYEQSTELHYQEVLDRMHRTLGDSADEGGEEPLESAPEKPAATPDDRQRIAELFTQARRDRSKTFDLKRELDRLGLFKEFEDPFLDLFRESA